MANLKGTPKKLFKEFLGSDAVITKEEFEFAKSEWLEHCASWRADNPPSPAAEAPPFQVDLPPLKKFYTFLRGGILERAGYLYFLLFIIGIWLAL